MKKEMIVRVKYVFEGKEHERTYIKHGNDDIALKQGFDKLKDYYLDLQKQYPGIRNLTITTEMIFDTRPMKFYYN